jgi:hypothetical protein
LIIGAFQYIYISNVCNSDELTVYGKYKAIKKKIGFVMKMSSMAAAFKKYKGKCLNIKGK